MKPRGMAFVSIGLYGVACAMMALYREGGPEGTGLLGYECLGLGLLFGFTGIPLLWWLPNPWLWTLWVRVFRGLDTPIKWAWGAPVLCAGVMIHLSSIGWRLRLGAVFWLVSIAVGALAARRVRA